MSRSIPGIGFFAPVVQSLHRSVKRVLEKEKFLCQSVVKMEKGDEKMPSRIDKEKTRKTISMILEKIATETDPQLLGEYNSLFKKEVSFFRRSWAAAYLLMLCDQGKSLRIPDREKDANRKVKKTADAGGETPSGGDETRQHPLSEEESTRLFFSAGRSRRVFPREILGLINTKTAVAKEDIGAIRILDNYSFVQVRDTVAEKIIGELNGIIFRGRPLTVNYAKTRNQENDSEENPGYPESKEDPQQDQNHSDEENI